MRPWIFVVAAVVLGHLASPSAAGLLRGTLRAKLDGEKLRTRDAHHFLDEVTGAYVVTSCIRHIPAPETGFACLHGVRIAFNLPAEGTGTVPCRFARYETYPSGDASADPVAWETFEGFGGGCSVEVRRSVVDRLNRAGRLRGLFTATVSPSSGQGGADRKIEAKFRTRLFAGNGD